MDNMLKKMTRSNEDSKETQIKKHSFKEKEHEQEVPFWLPDDFGFFENKDGALEFDYGGIKENLHLIWGKMLNAENADELIHIRIGGIGACKDGLNTIRKKYSPLAKKKFSENKNPPDFGFDLIRTVSNAFALEFNSDEPRERTDKKVEKDENALVCDKLSYGDSSVRSTQSKWSHGDASVKSRYAGIHGQSTLKSAVRRLKFYMQRIGGKAKYIHAQSPYMDCRDDEQARFNETKDEGTRQPELSFESIDIEDSVKSTFRKNVRTRLNKCMQRIGGKAKYIHAQSPYMDCRDDEQARFDETKDEGTRQPELSFESVDIEDTVKSTFRKNVRTRLNKCMQRIGGKAKYIHAQSPYMDCRDDEQARKDEGTRQPELSFESIDIEDTVKSNFRKNVRTRLNKCMQRIGGKAKYIHAQSPYMDCRDDEQARFDDTKDEGTRQPELSFESIDIGDTVKSTFRKNVRIRLNNCMLMSKVDYCGLRQTSQWPTFDFRLSRKALKPDLARTDLRKKSEVVLACFGDVTQIQNRQ
jgi:hypothetical protein